MSKKKTDLELIQELVEPEAPEPLKDYPNKAFSMYPVMKGVSIQYVLVEIPFDPQTGDTGEIKELSRDIKEDIIDRLKTQVADSFFRSE